MSACAEARHAWRYWRRTDWTGTQHYRRCAVCKIRHRRTFGLWVTR